MVKSSHIMLVEDNHMDVELLLEAFRETRPGNKVHVVHSGEEALDYLFGRDAYTDRTAHPLPDLVLLDLKLPGVDGHEVLRQIKDAPNLKRLPIIILSSSQENGDRARCYGYGANGYLVKPASFSGFLNMVRQVTDYWLTLNVHHPE